MTTICRIGADSDVHMNIDGHQRRAECRLIYGGIPYICNSRWELLEYAQRLVKDYGVNIHRQHTSLLRAYAETYEPKPVLI